MYSEGFGIEKLLEIKEYEDGRSRGEVIGCELEIYWGSIEKVLEGMGKVFGMEFENIGEVISEVLYENLDDMGYRIDEEVYLRWEDEREWEKLCKK